MRRLPAWLLTVCLAGCVVQPLDLEGKRCPCGPELRCDDASQRCVRAGADLGGADLAGGDAIDSDDLALPARPPNLFSNGDYELPSPLPGCDARTALGGTLESWGCRLCATELVGSEYVRSTYASSSTMDTARYRFELWVRLAEPTQARASLSIQVDQLVMGTRQFVGVTQEVFSAPMSGWQHLSVIMDPNDPSTRVTETVLELEPRLRIYGGTSMRCVDYDDWYLGPA